MGKDDFNQKFGALLTKGVRIVAAYQGIPLQTIEDELGLLLGYDSGKHMVEYWRKGKIPDYSVVVEITKYCVERGKLDREWAREFLDLGRVPERDKFLQEIFPDQSIEPPPSVGSGFNEKDVNSRITHLTEKQQFNPAVLSALRWFLPAVGLVVFILVLILSLQQATQRGDQETQIPITGGEIPAGVPPTRVPFAITQVIFDPSPPARAEKVYIFACTQGEGGVGITLKVSVNTAPDGSGNGEWIVLKELGVPCFNWDDAPVWHTQEWDSGTYLFKVEAKTAEDPNWERAEVEYVPYTLE